MGILECASATSVWRGYDYYKENKVASLAEIDKNIYYSIVEGSSSEFYSVQLNVEHPRKSKCNCPHADGKRIICKHIVATYFKALPEEAERFYEEAMTYQALEEKRREEVREKIIKHVGKMKKADLRQWLLELLFDAPEWQYERFISECGLDDDQ